MNYRFIPKREVKMFLKKFTFALGSALALTGCLDDVNSRELTERESIMIDYIVREGKAPVLAEIIADECIRYTYNEEFDRKDSWRMHRELRDMGFSPQEIDIVTDLRQLPLHVDAEFQSALFEYFEDNGLVSGHASTFCAVGEKEFEAKSAISNYLVFKG